MRKLRSYQGQKVTISFEIRRCVHQRYCVLGQPRVFMDPSLGKVEPPWIRPDNATAEELAALVQRCPSGALTYERSDGGPPEQAPAVNLIQIKENGPLTVHADIRLDGEALGFRATLCRCGASKNKPFCDSSHHDINFLATGEPVPGKTAALDERAGPLHIEPQRNGPILVTGNVELVAGSGRSIVRTRRVTLCRCGSSQNKPYCDGTHAKIGFSTD